MQALITGASSGMGEEMAKYLAGMGWDLILVARNKEKLDKVKNSMPKGVKVTVISSDLSYPDNAKNLFHQVKDMPVDMLINNAGFGIFGEFSQVDLDRELQLINTNITSLHILTKLFLQKFL